MCPIDFTVPARRRRADRVARLHLVAALAIAATTALSVDHPLPPPATLSARNAGRGPATARPPGSPRPATVTPEAPRSATDLNPVDRLSARLPAPTGPAAPWIDTF